MALIHPLSAPNPTHIIFSNRHEIRRLDVSKSSYVSLASGLKYTIALNFYFNQEKDRNGQQEAEGSLIFWSDVTEDTINRGTLISNCEFLNLIERDSFFQRIIIFQLPPTLRPLSRQGLPLLKAWPWTGSQTTCIGWKAAWTRSRWLTSMAPTDSR